MNNQPTPPTLRDVQYRLFYRPSDHPLESFYLPTLAASVQYERSAGFFRSSALAIAATGIARLIQNNGTMKLLVGAELTHDDAEAIARGYDLRERLATRMLTAFPDPSDGNLRQRLEALAWMVANGTLDIKVVLPLDSNGRLIPGDQAHDYYHTKKGIFIDAHGHQVAFMGSVNESAQAWQHNFEEFSVYNSWESPRDREHINQMRAAFYDTWEGRDPYWVSVELPAAVREHLLRYTPDHAPTLDPLEPEARRPRIAQTPATLATSGTPDERLLFQFLRDAPYLPQAQDIGAATSAIQPWPHQLHVARAVTARYPNRSMLCDEVGLGKTIEGGLIIRQLILTGRVKRCLILTPAAVLRQWQEELYEKFNLNLPRYDSGQLLDVHDVPVASTLTNPWNECDFLLASSHLARRSERRSELFNAKPWDLLVVDEAHHARRRDFIQQSQYRPNSLLTLLNGLRDKNKYEGLLLLTATPMQVHPVEVWDLLRVLGLGGRWGADERNFLTFFRELRQPYDAVDWDFVYDMVADYLQGHNQDAILQAPKTHHSESGLDPDFLSVMQAKLGIAQSSAVAALPIADTHRTNKLRMLPATAHPYVYEQARRHTPLRDIIFRNTRDLLRRYASQGLINERVPIREPRICRIPMRTEEQSLYERITEYITEFYARYEDQRRGTGFIMTIYRRRLTSSFYAVCVSLERRQKWLRGELSDKALVTDEDWQDEDIQSEAEEAGFEFEDQPIDRSGLTKEQRENFQREQEYLDDFLHELRSLSEADSKLSYLKDQLSDILRTRETVIIFTQYTDTMDYLRKQLFPAYGNNVACYSGRGGETWNGLTWVSTSKEDVKTRFRSGDIKILLCTESASEGLNLQTCGVLINYDMPWNPMRVEQRIGRIDRIGQKYERIWIRNFFYEDTIEDQVYQRLSDRISWFETVVGDLQPILARVGEVTRRLAMLPAAEQSHALEDAMKELRARIEDERANALGLSVYLNPEPSAASPSSPVTLSEIERILTQSSATKHFFTPHPEIADAYWLRLARQGQADAVAVTFSRDRFDEHPRTLQFLSYGNPLFAQILDSVPPPESPTPALFRFTDEQTVPIRGWYRGASTTKSAKQLVESINSLGQLRQLLTKLDRSTTVDANWEEIAQQQFQSQARQVVEQLEQQRRYHHNQQQNRLRMMTLSLLEQAALVEIALGRQQDLFSTEPYPTGFNEAAFGGLYRHKAPWSWMLHYAKGVALPALSESNPYYQEIQNLSREKLKEEFARLTDRAKKLRNTWKEQEGM
jgi:superfamily II DNA or RNA helicase